MSALDKYLPPGCSYEVPDGGYFILVKLPENISADEVLEEGVNNHKVRFLPGGSFGKTMTNYLRLSFSMYSADDISTGIQRLARAVGAVALRS